MSKPRFTDMSSYREWQIYLVAALVLLGVFYAVLYPRILYSGAYSMATDFVERNSEVRAAVGIVESTDLSTRYLRSRFSGTHEELRFWIRVKGNRDSAQVFFVMSQPTGLWTIDAATLTTSNGNKIRLR